MSILQILNRAQGAIIHFSSVSCDTQTDQMIEISCTEVKPFSSKSIATMHRHLSFLLHMLPKHFHVPIKIGGC